MAKGSITKICKECGREFTCSQKFFKRDDADKWENWAMKNIDLCEECYKELLAKQYLEQALEYEKENNLPKLKGSDKQIIWAEKIRYKVLKDVSPEAIAYLRKAISGFEESDLNMDALREAGKTIQEASEIYKEQNRQKVIMLTSTSAAEIIENR